MRIAICGLGRAGSVLAKRLLKDSKHTLVLGLCRESSSSLHQDMGDWLGVPHNNIPIISIEEYASDCESYNIDVIIDFSHKDTSLRLVDIIRTTNDRLVICTTNFSSEQIETIKSLAMNSNTGILMAPNLTIGINLLMEFVNRISRILPQFDFEIIERHRKDKPRVTTTAKLIAKQIDRESVPISSVRVGGYVGVHEVTAASENERLTIVHESFSREAFADGALLAAEFLIGKSGYYTMFDVVENLEKTVLQDC